MSGAAGTITLGTANAATPGHQSRDATFILVHGSWHGGWCWSRVAAILRAAGHTVFTPTLTGLADRSHLLSEKVDLETHIADVVNLIDWYDLQDVVLAGHSYGGVPVMAVADRRSDRIHSLFLLDAFLPKDGQSLVDVAHQPAPTSPTQPSPPASTFVMNKGDWPWVQSKLTPHPNGTRTQKVRLTGAWQGIAKKTYVRVSDFKQDAFDEALARCEGDNSWKTAKIANSGHDAMVDRPDEVAALLRAAI